MSQNRCAHAQRPKLGAWRGIKSSAAQRPGPRMRNKSRISSMIAARLTALLWVVLVQVKVLAHVDKFYDPGNETIVESEDESSCVSDASCFLRLDPPIRYYGNKYSDCIVSCVINTAYNNSPTTYQGEKASLVLYFCCTFPPLLQINTNGVVELTNHEDLGKTLRRVNSSKLPIEKHVFIAPFYANIDTRGPNNMGNAGHVLYSNDVIKEKETLQKAAEQISNGFSEYENFMAEYLIIATWDDVGYFDKQNDMVYRSLSTSMTGCM